MLHYECRIFGRRRLWRGIRDMTKECNVGKRPEAHFYNADDFAFIQWPPVARIEAIEAIVPHDEILIILELHGLKRDLIVGNGANGMDVRLLEHKPVGMGAVYNRHFIFVYSNLLSRKPNNALDEIYRIILG